jgi:hypothetical protein
MLSRRGPPADASLRHGEARKHSASVAACVTLSVRFMTNWHPLNAIDAISVSSPFGQNPFRTIGLHNLTRRRSTMNFRQLAIVVVWSKVDPEFETVV